MNFFFFTQASNSDDLLISAHELEIDLNIKKYVKLVVALNCPAQRREFFLSVNKRENYAICDRGTLQLY